MSYALTPSNAMVHQDFVPRFDHKQAYSHVLDTHVDENMLAVLEHLNAHGVKTLYSCQGTMPLKPSLMKHGEFWGKRGYVGFASRSLEAFLPFLEKTPWARLDADKNGELYVFPPCNGSRVDPMICVRFPRRTLRRTIRAWLSVS